MRDRDGGKLDQTHEHGVLAVPGPAWEDPRIPKVGDEVATAPRKVLKVENGDYEIKVFWSDGTKDVHPKSGLGLRPLPDTHQWVDGLARDKISGSNTKMLTEDYAARDKERLKIEAERKIKYEAEQKEGLTDRELQAGYYKDDFGIIRDQKGKAMRVQGIHVYRGDNQDGSFSHPDLVNPDRRGRRITTEAVHLGGDVYARVVV